MSSGDQHQMPARDGGGILSGRGVNPATRTPHDSPIELSTAPTHNASPPGSSSREAPERRSATVTDYEVPDRWPNVGDVAAAGPVRSSRERTPRQRMDSGDGSALRAEGHGSGQLATPQDLRDGLPEDPPRDEDKKELNESHVSKLATQVYTVSYLVFFSLLGTLARVGLAALTKYPGTPIIFTTVWANVGGSLIMGFLAEDRMLFRHEWGTPTYDQHIMRARAKGRDQECGSALDRSAVDLTAAKKAHLAAKKTIPLYIGLATGFCGSFTSFSAFIKDTFLALSNDMVTPGLQGSPTTRNGGYSFMAMLAVIIGTVSLSMSALNFGAHLAVASERFTPSIPYPVTRKGIDRAVVVLGWGCWLGAVLLAIFPPDDAWRGQVLFSLVFAPPGCLARFYLSLHLNGRTSSFPAGTFAANVLGTVVLGMAWDVAHVPVGGVVGCQVLQGVQDGFCGCLTTISTWVAELSGLRRRHAYVYGAASVVVSLVLLIAVMGGLRWSDGFGSLACSI